MLKSSADQVLLCTQLPSLPGISRQTCLIQLVMVQGSIHSCTITSKDGRVLLQQQEAYHALGRCGELEWQVKAFPATALSLEQSRTRPLAGTEERGTRTESGPLSIPTLRISPLSSEILASLSHPYRMALVLVDGKRSIHEIARLLSKSPRDIQQMLVVLQHLVQL